VAPGALAAIFRAAKAGPGSKHADAVPDSVDQVVQRRVASGDSRASGLRRDPPAGRRRRRPLR
jgi:hypothetical protein